MTALLLAAGVALTGGDAKAGCGDHVVILGPADGPPTPKPPCHGPLCSAAPAPLDVPLTLPVEGRPSGHDPALAAILATADPADARRSLPPSDDGRPVKRPAVPLDPPRFG